MFLGNLGLWEIINILLLGGPEPVRNTQVFFGLVEYKTVFFV